MSDIFEQLGPLQVNEELSIYRILMHLFCHLISIIVISDFIMSKGVEVNKEIVITDETINKDPESNELLKWAPTYSSDIF